VIRKPHTFSTDIDVRWVDEELAEIDPEGIALTI